MIQKFSVILIIAIIGCRESAQSVIYKDKQSEIVSDSTSSNEKVDPQNLFTISEAEKILGEPAHLSDSSTVISEKEKIYKCSYTADSTDKKSGKTGVIYVLFEEYNQLSDAEEKYSSTKKANENHEGIKTLDELGDEAYFHSDGENFYFIMARKGKNVLIMKVNKTTGFTSLDEFNKVAKKIIESL